MAWHYDIASGRMYRPDGTLIGVGYSGFSECKNDPSKVSVHDRGPIPYGRYDIGPPIDTVTHGPFVLPLTPSPMNTMWGRSGFLIHGDSIVEPGSASLGCIIMSRDVRVAIAGSGDNKLEVVAGA